MSLCIASCFEFRSLIIDGHRPESERYYNFTELASQLNEPEENLAPTDSRLRPDQRLMEDGKWDEANEEKLRLEEKQRAARRQRELDSELAVQEGAALMNLFGHLRNKRLFIYLFFIGRPVPAYEPIWFEKQKDPFTGTVIHMYNGKYWDCKEKQDWEECPDIF